MKKLLTLSLIVASAILVWAERTEHRSVFNTAMLNDWPYGHLTEANMEEQKVDCIKMLDSLAVNNFTTVFFHARAMCDAYYESSYEPWAAGLSGTRGKKPPFDPLAMIIEEGHKRGLEIYAWVNPFRYSNSSTKNYYGAGDLNYENTHPEWLISNENQTILNPAHPEARQRVIDVCTEIATKYDIDGIVFDDYFYPQGGMASDASAEDYAQFAASGRPMSEYGDWRRDNVNTFVAEFGKKIKAVKPWLRFGISPAGVCGTAKTSASKYGVKPSPGEDWQYNTIFCDPLNWMVNGTVDFLCPQLYAHDSYTAVAEWYYYIAKKFDRHVYPAQMLVPYPQVEDFDRILNEINVTRVGSTHHAPGYSFFPWINLFNAAKVVSRKKTRLMSTLRFELYTNKSWTPHMTWESWGDVPMPTNVAFDGTTLTWNGASNVRYLVYAYPKTLAASEFDHQEEYIKAITYATSYTPDAETIESCNFAVATLDRHGHETSAVMVGETLGSAQAVSLDGYLNGEEGQGIFYLRWNSDATRFIVELAADKEFTKPVYSNITTDKFLCSTTLPAIANGTKLYWRVRAMAANCNDTYSNVGQLTFVPLQFTYPLATTERVPQAPTFTWNAAKGTSYRIKIADNLDMKSPVVDAEVEGGSYAVPEATLVAGATYYAQLIGGTGDEKLESEPMQFKVECIAVEIPTIVVPAVDGATLYSTDVIAVNEQKGASQFRIEVSASETFPPRTLGLNVLDAFTYSTKTLSSMTKPSFTEGTTYYVQARASYINEDGATINTEYTPVRTFVYGGEAGVEGIEANGIRLCGNTLVVSDVDAVEAVEVYTAAGVLAATVDVKSTNTSLTHLPQGVSLIKVITTQGATVLKMAR